MVESAAKIVSITPTILRWLNDYSIDDLVDYYDPDAFFVIDEEGADVDFRDVRSRFDPVCIYPARENKRIRHVSLNGIEFIIVDGVENLDIAKEIEKMGEISEDDNVYLVTTDLDVEIDTTSLSASLVNQDAYKTHSGDTKARYVYITGSLQSSYRQEWGKMAVQGARPREIQGGLAIPQLTCFSDGRVGVKTLESHKLGLRALEGVGRRTVEKLEANGYHTREEVSNATRGDLKEIYGIGEKTANKLWYHSRAMVKGKVMRRTNYPVPGKNPVFISIETDGVTPSVIWHICVYNSKSKEYKIFYARTPEQKQEVIQSFMSWYAANGTDQTILSWKGWEGDYHHLTKFIAEYTPEYGSIWDKANKRDLYFWTTEQNNAVLPGRTDDIVEHATELGYDIPNTGLTSNYVRKVYRQWMSNEVSEPNWELIHRYHKAKIDALVGVHKEIIID